MCTSRCGRRRSGKEGGREGREEERAFATILQLFSPNFPLLSPSPSLSLSLSLFLSNSGARTLLLSGFFLLPLPPPLLYTTHTAIAAAHRSLCPLSLSSPSVTPPFSLSRARHSSPRASTLLTTPLPHALPLVSQSIHLSLCFSLSLALSLCSAAFFPSLSQGHAGAHGRHALCTGAAEDGLRLLAQGHGERTAPSTPCLCPALLRRGVSPLASPLYPRSSRSSVSPLPAPAQEVWLDLLYANIDDIDFIVKAARRLKVRLQPARTRRPRLLPQARHAQPAAFGPDRRCKRSRRRRRRPWSRPTRTATTPRRTQSLPSASTARSGKGQQRPLHGAAQARANSSHPPGLDQARADASQARGEAAGTKGQEA